MASNKLSSVKIFDIQEKYGVVFDQPAYGVVLTPPVQPAYGVRIPTQDSDINITYGQLEDMIATLKKAISTMKETWDAGTRSNVAKLDASWVGKDCAAYTARLNKMNNKVQRTIQALELLCSTYEKARDMVKENQSKTTAAIYNID